MAPFYINGSTGISGVDGSAATPALQGTDTNTGISFGSDVIIASTGGTEKARLTASGQWLVGTSTARSNFFGTTLSAVAQTEGTGGAAGRGALSVINNDISNNPPYVLLGRSGAATLGSNAAVVSGSRLGTLTFHGADGTSFIEAATVAGEVDGTPGTNDMPGRLVFSTTADGASSPTERARIDSSGRLLVGTSTSVESDSIIQIKGRPGGGIGAVLPSFIGNNTSDLVAGNGLCYLNFYDGFRNGRGAYIGVEADASWGANDFPTRLVFSVTADGASTPSTALTINQNKTLTSEGDIFVKGGLFVSDPITTNRYLYKSSTGGGTATVYIGNAAIQVSSDARLKDNIQDTTLSAVEELQKVRVVDFIWNDPSDTSYNNRNARGTWTGVIAQELIEVFPFAVNAPRKEDDLSIDHDSDSTWTVEQQQLVPVLIKAIQEQQAVIADLQSRLSALESA